MDYDNVRDRFTNGFDAGLIIDGKVLFDKDKNEYVIVDEDGVALSLQDLLKSLMDQKVRLTCVSFESMEMIESMLSKTHPVN
jgi:hypothetical protein